MTIACWLILLAQDVGPNAPDEPVAKAFSAEKARKFLDDVSLQWQRERKCLTCHTNQSYLMTVPETGARTEAGAEIRKFVESLVSERWEQKGPRWDAEVVSAAASLAFDDAASGGKLHPLTRKALDRMWTVQRADGGWNWLKCNWPPMESDDYYGATLALLAAGRAPEGYLATPAAQDGVKKARAYLAKTPAPSLHHRGMLLWASTFVEGLLTADEKAKALDALLALQREDGGWASATLGDWKRGDGKEQETRLSDGYGTGFVVVVARAAGLPASDARLKRAVAWLKSQQRESGRWFARSLYKDGRSFLTHAGTAFALLALHSCGELSP
jgi:squalene-hopene/tetraprenyl-beta-curcumene cyclase